MTEEAELKEIQQMSRNAKKYLLDNTEKLLIDNTGISFTTEQLREIRIALTNILYH